MSFFLGERGEGKGLPVLIPDPGCADLMFHLLERERFPEPMARFYCAEICCGLFFLHEHGVV